MKSRLLILLGLSLYGSAALADMNDVIRGLSGYDPGQLDNTNFIQSRIYEARTKYEKSKDPAIIQEEIREKMELNNAKQVSFVLKDVKITGNTVYPEYVLRRYVDYLIGQKVTINDLIACANDITDYYQGKGYISTIAYLPEQKVQHGVVEIQILEGKYGNIEINAGKWERTSYLKKNYLIDRNIEPGKILNIKDVRNSLIDMNTEEYMKGSIAFSDNEESEEYADVTLSVKDRFPINFDLRFDNQGREAIGTERGVLYAGLHDVTGNGDTLMGTLAVTGRSLGAGGIYSLPIAKNETRLNLGYSYSFVELKQNFFNIKGKSHDMFVGVSRRLARGDNYKLYGDLTFDMRNTYLSSKYAFIDRYLTDYKTRTLKGTLTDIIDDDYGKWLVGTAVTGGLPIFGASDNDKARDMHSNSFVKVNANVARLQVMPYNQIALLQINTQYANRHLWASEAMQFGGISSVRGYDEAFRIGDYGVTASVEYRAPIPGFRAILPEKYKFISDSIQLAGFYDFGWFGDRFIKDSSDYIMSAGPGIVVKLTKYLSANLYWGFPIGKILPDYRNRLDRKTCRFHFTVTSNIL